MDIDKVVRELIDEENFRPDEEESRQQRNFFRGKTVLVTGGAGSIGSEIVWQLLGFDVKAVRVFDNSEYNIYQSLNRSGKDVRVRLIVGDVTDRKKIEEVMHGVDIVFHAAAMKHVDIVEYNLDQAIMTNVIGTLNVMRCAMASQSVEAVVNISTDKACESVSAMGTTKALGEHIAGWSHRIGSANGRKRFISIRFGNVLASRGSVLETWENQKNAGKPITVTDPDMVRYFMTIPQAAQLILLASRVAGGGDLCILDMPKHRLGDIAAMVSDKCEIIGPRPGEKHTEVLMTKDERSRARKVGKMFIIHAK